MPNNFDITFKQKTQNIYFLRIRSFSFVPKYKDKTAKNFMFQ